MLYLLSGILTAVAGWLIWRRFVVQKRGLVVLAGDLALAAALAGFLAVARSMLVYKPLMVLHLAALLLYGYALARRLLGLSAARVLFFLPAVTTGIFFVAARLFGEGV